MKIRNICLKLGGNDILNNLSFDINSKTALIGPNGSGKTTTLSVLSQLIRPDKGTVTFGNSGNVLEDENFKNKLGVMIQEGNFDPDRKVIDEIRLIQNLKKDNTNISKLLKKYKIDENLLVKQLPHGKYVILLVLQALLGNPELVLLDEPFSGLDVLNRRIMEKILREYPGKLLITTHLLGEIRSFCKDIVFIKDGRIVKKKKVSEIKNLDEYYIKLYKE